MKLPLDLILNYVIKHSGETKSGMFIQITVGPTWILGVKFATRMDFYTTSHFLGFQAVLDGFSD